MQQRDSRREQFWRDALARWKASGQSVRRFCAEHRITQSNFYAWRRKLAERDATGSAPVKAISPTRRRSPRPTPKLVPLRVIADAMIEIVLPTGVMLRVPGGVEVATKLVTTLASSSC